MARLFSLFPLARIARIARAAVPLAAVPLAGGLAACGPSFQAIYEGNARFEHCYALEENPQASMPDKATCWRDWSERYTYGQTRDRVHYATARYVALSQAPKAPTDEALMMAAPGEAPRVSAITAPAPTNAFAPPPKVLDPNDASGTKMSHANDRAGVLVLGAVSDAGAPAPPPAVALPAASCADACAGSYRVCSGGCEGAEAVSALQAKETCQTCLKTYRGCMRACFK